MTDKDTDTAVFQEQTSALSSTIAPGEIVIGLLAGIDTQGQPLVDYPENPFTTPLLAISTLSITQQHVGRNVALLFAKGNPNSPVIMGLIHSPLHDLIATYDATNHEHTAAEQPTATPINLEDITIDGKRVVIEGKEEIVLKCGEASITLTRAGKILIRGKYLLNRADGVNRIMGGSVQVN